MFYNIEGFDEYLVSKCGKIKSNKTNRLLTPCKNSNGYYQIFFYKNGVRIPILLHRLLAFVFKDLPNLDSGFEVDHRDNNPSNNSLSNLQVLTKEQHLMKSLKTRGHKRLTNTCNSCGKKLSKHFYDCCKECTGSKSEKLGLKVEDIEFWVINYSWVRASKELGLSDNGLRKFYFKNTGKDPKKLKPKRKQD